MRCVYVYAHTWAWAWAWAWAHLLGDQVDAQGLGVVLTCWVTRWTLRDWAWC